MRKNEEYCKSEIKKKYGELNKGFKTITEIQVQLGQLFTTLKGIVQKDGKKWKAYVKKNFQYMNIRTVQRWMKIGEAVKLDKYPQLAYAGQTRLLALANIAKKEDSKIHLLLKDNKIKLKPNAKKSELRKFKDKIDSLIEDKRGEQKKQPTTKKIVERLSNTVQELSSKLDEDDMPKSINKKVIDDSIEEIEDLLDQLKELRNRMKKVKRSKKKKAA